MEEHVGVWREEGHLSYRLDQPNRFDIDLVIVKCQYSVKLSDGAFMTPLRHELYRGTELASTLTGGPSFNARNTGSQA